MNTNPLKNLKTLTNLYLSPYLPPSKHYNPKYTKHSLQTILLPFPSTTKLNKYTKKLPNLKFKLSTYKQH